MRTIMEAEFVFKDNRGTLKQLFSSQRGWKQVNYATSKKDVARGGHYHKMVTETFYLIHGRIKVMIKNVKTGREQSKIFETGDMFQIEPYDKHTLIALEDSEWIAVFDNIINNSDVHKD